MREILSTEQPCILCGQCLEIVTVYLGDVEGEEKTRREKVPHDDVACRSFLRLRDETWPPCVFFVE